MKFFCEISFKIEILKIENEAFLRDFLQNWFVEQIFDLKIPICESDFQMDVLKVLCLPRKSCAEVYEILGIRNPVDTTRNDHCKAILPWHETCNPCTVSASNTLNIDITNHKIYVPVRQNASFHNLFKSPTLANLFCNPHKLLWLLRLVLQHIKIPAPATQNTLWTSKNLPRPSVFNNFDFRIRSRAQTWCKFCEAQLPKVLGACQVLTILTSISLSRSGVVRILRSSTSKSVPIMPVFDDFDLQIVLARRRGANFAKLNFQKVLDTASF